VDLFFLTLIRFAAGWLLFGIAAQRLGSTRVGQPCSSLVGAVIFVLPLPFTAIVLSVAVGWLGFHLFTGRDAAEARTSPRVS
jgi:hypothetical protein